MSHSRWGTEELFEQLAPLLPGLSIEVLARTDSTNTQLLERARLHAPSSSDAVFGRRAGDTQPCLLVAEHQTAGRGRLGRVWKSAPEASLTFSLAVPLRSADWSGLSLAVGLALAEALDPPSAGTPPALKLKWPNDIWLADASAEGGGRKLGGVLIESLAVGSRRMAVVGVGLNVRAYDHGMPSFSAGIASIEEIDRAASAPSVLAKVAPALAQSLIEFDAGGGFAPKVAAYCSRDLLCGQRVRVSPGGPEGVADGVAGDGSLRIVDDDGALQLVGSGEVSVRFAGSPTTQ